MTVVNDFKILVVEDDLRMCDSLRQLLVFNGFEVDISVSLVDALNALVFTEYDLILLDLLLDDQCGFAVMDQLAERQLDSQVVVITGHSSENCAIKALKKGARDYLKKPFNPDTLLDSVDKALGYRKSQRELNLCRRIVASSSEAILVGDRDGHIVYANKAYNKLVGSGSSSAEDSANLPKAKGEYGGWLGEEFQSIFETGMPLDGMLELHDASGQRSILWNRVDAIFDADGHVAYSLVLMHDITAQVENENIIALSRDRYRLVVDTQKAYLCCLNPDGEVTFMNRPYAEFWGKEPKQMIGLPFLSLVPESIKDSVSKHLIEIHSGSTIIDFDYDIINEQGQHIWQHWQYQGITSEVGDVVEVQCVGQDITQRKEIEEELKISNERFRSLAEFTSDWVWEVDREGVYTYASPVVQHLLGYQPEAIIGQRPSDFMPKEEAARVEKIFKDALISGKSIRNLENINFHKNGNRVMLETSGVPIVGSNGETLGYRGVDRDISERKLAEKILLDERDKLKKAFAEINKLSGMLPICASCKKIRDDKGYWNQIEEYIQTHSEAEFTHGICPECAKKLYPYLYQSE